MKLVGLAYADLPRYHQEEMTLDLFCSSLCNAYLQRHLLAIKPGSEYLHIKPGSTFGTNVRQVDEENAPDQVQATQTNPSAMEILLQALRRLMSGVEELKETRRTTTDNKKKGICWKCGKEGHL